MAKTSVRLDAGTHDVRWIDPFIALEKSIEEMIRLAAVRFDTAGERRRSGTRRRRRARRDSPADE